MVIINIFLIWIIYNLLISNLNYKFKIKNNILGCGLIGFSGGDNFDKNKIKTLIYINSIERGEDSTGLYSPLNGLNKSLKKGSEFATEHDTDFKEDTLLIAHVRSSTIGNTIVGNAHPFERGNYILAHNGTLTNHWDLLRKYNLGYDSGYSVDSDMIAGCLAKDNNFDVLKLINGGAAFLIHDKTVPNRLYAFKNKERPLFKGLIDGNMYISSIKESLVLIGCINIKEFKDDTLYIIEDAKIIKTLSVKNTPYKEVINTYSNTNSFKVKCRVRPRYSIPYTYKGKKYYLSIEKYYIIDKLDGNKRVVLFDDENDCLIGVNINNILKEDLLEVGDYAIALEDIYERGLPKRLVASKDEIVCITTMYTDGDFGFKSVKINTFGYPNTVPTYASRMYIRKLTKEEKIEYISSRVQNLSLNNNTPNHLQNTILNNVLNQNTEPIIPFINSLNNETETNIEETDIQNPVINKEEEELNLIDGYAKIDKELRFFFEKIAEKIEEMEYCFNYIDVDKSIRDEISEMKDLIFTYHKRLYVSRKEENAY